MNKRHAAQTYVTQKLKKYAQAKPAATVEFGAKIAAEPTVATHDEGVVVPFQLAGGDGKIHVDMTSDTAYRTNENILPVADPVDAAMQSNTVNGVAMPTAFQPPPTVAPVSDYKDPNNPRGDPGLGTATSGPDGQPSVDWIKDRLMHDPTFTLNGWSQEAYDAFNSPEMKAKDPTLGDQYIRYLYTQSTLPQAQRDDPLKMDSKNFNMSNTQDPQWMAKALSYMMNPQKHTDSAGVVTFEQGTFRPLPVKNLPINSNAINAQSDLDPSLPPITDTASTTLRDHFMAAAPADVTPTPERQLQSDIQFDLFNAIPPGFGLGQRNKLFVENEQREDFLRFRNNYPLRPDPGVPTNVTPPPWQWQEVQPPALVSHWFEKISKQVESVNKLVGEVLKRGAATVSSLPDDAVTIPSSKGLTRAPTPFVPVVQNRQAFIPNVQPAGVYMNRRPFRHLTSSWRNPETDELDVANAGPVFRRRRQFAYNLE